MSNEKNPDFQFVGGEASLDLINTETIVRGGRLDLIQSQGELNKWWQAVTQLHPVFDVVPAKAMHFDPESPLLFRAFRERLRHLFMAVINDDAIDNLDLAMLNDKLALAHRVITVDPETGLKSGYEFMSPSVENALFPFALSALELISERSRERIRKCHNDRCIMLFYDSTKSATRQWCSPACLERERSASRYSEYKMKKGLP